MANGTVPQRPANDNRVDYSKQRMRRLLGARMRGRHTQDEWDAMLAHCNYACVRCGWRERVYGPTLSKDHILPISRGGSDAIDNLQPLCIPCNRNKGAREATDYRPADWHETITDARA